MRLQSPIEFPIAPVSTINCRLVDRHDRNDKDEIIRTVPAFPAADVERYNRISREAHEREMALRLQRVQVNGLPVQL